MSNLTADLKVDERLGKRFAYKVKAGVKFYRGSLVAVTSAGLAVKVGDGSAAAFVGVCPAQLDNTNGADGDQVVEPRRGVLQIVVPSATHANIGAAVYATDDATATLTVGTNLKIGTLVGIEAGLTYVEV